MVNSRQEDSKLIFLDPVRHFGSSGSLADVLFPYLKQEVFNRLSGEPKDDSSGYNSDTHKAVSHQGGAA